MVELILIINPHCRFEGELRFNEFPFQVYKPFKVMIMFVDKGFLITVNGKLYAGHKYSDGPKIIRQLGGLRVRCKGPTVINMVKHYPGFLNSEDAAGFEKMSYSHYNNK